MNPEYIKKYSNLNDRARVMAKLIRERQIEKSTKKLQDKNNDHNDEEKSKSNR